MMKQNYKFYIGLVLAFLIYGIFIYVYYMGSTHDLLKESSDCFSEAVNKDRTFRLREANIPIYANFSPEDTVIQMTIEREGYSTICKEKTDSIRQLPNTTILNHTTQTILLHKNPIHANMLDNLFRTELQKENIKAQTIIQYTDNTTNKTYSYPDSLPKKGFDRLPEVIVGINAEIILRASVKLSPASIVRNAASAMGGITFIWVILMSVLIYFTSKKENVEVEVEVATEQSERKQAQLTDILYLEADKNCLIYNQQEIKLTGQYTQFLSILFNRPKYFASYEELIKKLYGEIEKEAGKERLSQLTKRIRMDVFASIPEVELKNTPQKGYRVVVLIKKSIAV
jgi:DNA-binding winged helix-turn-helix (wHTH) protein